MRFGGFIPPQYKQKKKPKKPHKSIFCKSLRCTFKKDVKVQYMEKEISVPSHWPQNPEIYSVT